MQELVIEDRVDNIVNKIIENISQSHSIVQFVKISSNSMNNATIQILRPLMLRRHIFGVSIQHEKSQINEIIVQKDESAFEKGRGKLNKIGKYLDDI